MFIILLILVSLTPFLFFYISVNDTKIYIDSIYVLYINVDVIYYVFGTILYNLYKHKKPKPLQPPLGNAAREIA